MSKTIMIHELNKEFTEFLKTLDEEYIFTFDDGLYSQYKFMIENKELLEKHKCLFFVSTNIICPENIEQSEDFITSEDAHIDYFETGNLKNYMKLSQIHELERFDNVNIGMHGSQHIHIQGTIKQIYENTKNDTERMIESMQKFGLETNLFCFPYNEESPILKALLVRNGFDVFYGNERIDFFTMFNKWNKK